MILAGKIYHALAPPGSSSTANPQTIGNSGGEFGEAQEEKHG